MVPKVAGKGRSFAGAGLYYLHDKKASTRDRVAFTHTENLPTSDPDKAIKCMAWTAIRQQQLKSLAGGSAKGRKLTQPVYCYSLSWAPGEEPSHEEMISAARATIKALGLDGHEALFVGHNDEAHPHIHVIVNRVHSETGIAAKLSNDHLKLSSWAEEYERIQGQIRCEQRVENNKRRRYGEFVKDHHSQHAAEFRRWQQERTERQVDKRALDNAVMDMRHGQQRDRLRAHRDKLIDEKRHAVSDANRSAWRSIYRDQFKQRRELADAQRSAWSRLRFFVRTHGPELRSAGRPGRKALFKGAFRALIGSQKQHTELERKQRSERAAQGARVKAQVNELTQRIRKDYERDLAQLRNTQARERHQQDLRHAAQSKDQAKEIKEGRDRALFEREQDEKREREISENKKDITSDPPRRGRPVRERGGLADKFKAAKRGGETRISKGQEQPKPNAMKENIADVTRRSDPSPKSLRDQFKRARDGQQQDVLKNPEFSRNKSEITRGPDQGRERTRSISPPSGKKPD